MRPLSDVPVVHELRGLRGALVVAVVDVLDDGFSVVQFVGVGHVVEEEQQVVGRGGGGLVDLRDFWRVLADVARAGGDGAIHADAFVIGAVPLAPAVVFAGLDVRAVVAAGDVGERLQAERAGVVFVRGPDFASAFL